MPHSVRKARVTCCSPPPPSRSRPRTPAPFSMQKTNPSSRGHRKAPGTQQPFPANYFQVIPGIRNGLMRRGSLYIFLCDGGRSRSSVTQQVVLQIPAVGGVGPLCPVCEEHGSRARGSVPMYLFKAVLALRRIRILFQL